MDAKELADKIAGNDSVKEALGADVVKALGAILSSASDSEKKLKESEAKAGRILAEKKEAQEKLSALEADVENLKKTGMSEADKVKAETDKVLKRAEKAEKDLAAVQAEFGKAKRAVALDKVAAQVKFIDAVTPDAGRILLDSSLSSVQDLNDAEAVAAAIVSFREAHKSLIAADSQASGAGTSRPNGSGAGNANPTPDKQSPAEREAQLKKEKII